MLKDLFSKIETTEEADKVIRYLSILLYAMAALDFVIYVIVLAKPASLVDVAFLALSVFILRRTRSRCVAAVVAAYALLVLARAGLYEGTGTNVIVAGIVALTAARGVYATLVYHRNQGTRANPRGVLALTAIAAGLSGIAFFTVVVLALRVGFDLESDADSKAIGQWLLPALAAPWFLVFGRALPFVRGIRVTKSVVS